MDDNCIHGEIDANSITTHADMKLSIRPAAPPPPIISIMANDYRPLLTIHPDGTVTGEIENASEAARVFVDHIRKYIGEPQTDARVADLLFKLDVAATTFEKVTTSERREAVFNAEHAKLLRDTIKVLHQPQTDALKVVREALEGLIDHCVEQERVITEEMHHRDYCGESAPVCAARAALEARGLEIVPKAGDC